jgi:hypothetical protein
MEDISSIAKNLGIFEKVPSLKDLSKKLLKGDMDKTLARSYWDGVPTAPLQQPLVEYAGLDVWVSLYVAKILEGIRARLPDSVRTNDEVSLFDTSGKMRIAYGKVVSLVGSQHECRVHLTRIFVGSYRLTASQRTQRDVEHGIKTLAEMDAAFNSGGEKKAGFEISWKLQQLKHRVSLADMPSLVVPRLDSHLNVVPEDTELEQRGQRVAGWKGETVKLDMFHFMARTSDLISKGHGIRRLFMSRWRDSIFAVNQRERADWEKRETEKLQKAGFLSKAIKSRLGENYKKMLSKTTRLIPPPDELHSAMHATYSLFGYQIDRKTGDPLFSQKAWDSVDEGDKHVAKGCCSDHPEVDLYYTSAADDKTLFNARGSSALESWHKYLRLLLAGRTTISPVSAMHLVLGKGQRWNMQMAITRLGERDYGTFDMAMLIALKQVDMLLSIADSKYALVTDPTEFVDTGEKFGILDLSQDFTATRLTTANDDDAEPWMECDEHGDSSDEEEESSSGVVLSPGFRTTRAEKMFNEHAG